MNSGEKPSHTFCHGKSLQAGSLFARVPWDSACRRMGTGRIDTGESTGYAAQFIPKKPLEWHTLRVETSCVLNQTEDTSSMGRPFIAPDLCRQMHQGNSQTYVIFHGHPHEITTPFNPRQPCLLPTASFLEKHTELKTSSAASSIIKCSTHRKGTDRSGIHQAGRHGIISLGSWMWLTWIHSLPGNDCDCQRRLVYDY